MSAPVAAGAAAIALLALLGASELMVRQLSRLGRRLGLAEPHLGLLVALGADAPEVSTAIFALTAGSTQIGLGVVEGSNLYNLAGLLGLSALLAGPLLVSRPRVLHDGLSNLAVSLAVGVLIVEPNWDIVLAPVVLLAFGAYLVSLGAGRDAGDLSLPLTRPLLLAAAGIAGIVVAAAVLVQSSIALIDATGIPGSVIGILVLPVATSLPNTWGALHLARQGFGDATVATTFNSNSLNLVFGVALPSLFIRLHPLPAERILDGPYLLGMTIVVLVLALTNTRLARVEGAAIVALYVVFLVVRFAVPL